MNREYRIPRHGVYVRGTWRKTRQQEGATPPGCVQSKLASAGIRLNDLFGDLLLLLVAMLTVYSYPELR